ncbi:MAG: hypothetical protein AB8G17_11340 [Gammaproteobacteria bacterium]
MKRCTPWLSLAALLMVTSASAAINQTKGTFQDKFRQLDESLPTANSYRTAGGEPGQGFTPNSRTLMNRPIMALEERHVQEKKLLGGV